MGGGMFKQNFGADADGYVINVNHLILSDKRPGRI